MSSTRKLAAARANGAKARGRKSPEGIARSARNATRHGLLARMSVLSSEDPAAFMQLMDSYRGRLCPDGSPEGGCVEELVSAYWRSRRAWAVETEMLNKEISAQPEGDELSRMAAAFVKLAGTPEFAVLRRYETSFLRSFRRSLGNLLLLRRNFPKKTLIPFPDTRLRPLPSLPFHPPLRPLRFPRVLCPKGSIPERPAGIASIRKDSIVNLTRTIGPACPRILPSSCRPTEAPRRWTKMNAGTARCIARSHRLDAQHPVRQPMQDSPPGRIRPMGPVRCGTQPRAASGESAPSPCGGAIPACCARRGGSNRGRTPGTSRSLSGVGVLSAPSIGVCRRASSATHRAPSHRACPRPGSSPPARRPAAA